MDRDPAASSDPPAANPLLEAIALMGVERARIAVEHGGAAHVRVDVIISPSDPAAPPQHVAWISGADGSHTPLPVEAPPADPPAPPPTDPRPDPPKQRAYDPTLHESFDPAHVREDHCRSCNALIWWGYSVKNRRTPYDLDPKTRTPTPISHFTTCPAAQDWTHRNRSGQPPHLKRS